MSPHSVKKHLANAETNALLIDVREPEEFQICNIPGSRLIPMHQISHHLDQFDSDQELIIVCHHGIRSRQVADFLEYKGFSHVINLSGGIAAWAEEIDPTMRQY